MPTPLNGVIDPLASKTFTFSPGISPIYDVIVTNNNNTRKAVASISYDRFTGTLTVVMGEAGV